MADIITGIKELPPGIKEDAVITTMIFCAEEWYDFEPIPVKDLVQLVADYERMREARDGWIEYANHLIANGNDMEALTMRTNLLAIYK